MLRRWLDADAEWWEFWMPQSGGIGGAIVGGVITSLVWWLRAA